MKQIVTKGIVLARTDFSEADRILTILTIDQGKIRAIAKGVRKIKSKLAGGIELFSVSHVSYIQGKSDIYTLTSTRLDKHYDHIVSDIDRTMTAYEILKRVNRVTEDNAEAAYFDLLKSILESLDNIEIRLPLIQFWFNLQLLKIAGQSPNLQTDTDGKKLAANQKYNFDPDKMTFILAERGSYTSQHIKLLRLAQNIDSPKPLSKINNLEQFLSADLQLSKTICQQFEH